MRFRHFVPMLGASALALGLASPALAHDGHDHPAPDYTTDAEGRVYGEAMPEMPQPPAPMPHAGHPEGAPHHAEMRPDFRDEQRARWDQERAEWLEECRYRMSSYERRGRRGGRDRDHGLGGALIGAAAGGLIGNRVADGDRTAGTVIGTVAGAAVGAAIDRSDGAGNRDEGYRGRGGYRGDYCEQYFDYYTQGGYGHGGYGYGYGAQMVMVPVTVQQAQPCTETVVTEEYVTVRQRGHRHTPRRPRVRHVPDKRLRM